MKRSFFIAVFVMAITASFSQDDIKISVHPGVELVTIIFKLSGRFPPSKPSKYEKEVDAYFEKYKNLPAVKDLKAIKTDFIYTDFTELGFCFTDYPDFKLYIPDSTHWDKYYGKDVVKKFLFHAKEFAVQSNFLNFFKQHIAQYPAWGEKIKEGIRKDSLDEKLYNFYRSKNKPGFYICLDPLNGWGNHAIPNPEVYNPVYKNVKALTLGYDPIKIDSNEAPIFPYWDFTTNLIWHEGGHVYLEPIFQKYKSEISALSYMYNKDDDGMRKQQINNWEYCLNENINRGVVLALLKKYRTNIEWRKQNAREILGDFIYAEDLSNFILQDYVASDKYKNFESYFPQLLKRLKEKYAHKDNYFKPYTNSTKNLGIQLKQK